MYGKHDDCKAHYCKWKQPSQPDQGNNDLGDVMKTNAPGVWPLICTANDNVILSNETSKSAEYFYERSI